MNDLGLGELITTPRERDAIHVAVAPVVAGETLNPGTHVGIDSDGKARLFWACDPKRTKAAVEAPIGVVDPFLATSVPVGATFWLFLYPGSITSLRHDWTHPAFAVPQEKSDSEIWLRAYAMRMNFYDTPQEAFDRLIKGLRSGELFSHGSDLHGLYELDDSDALRYHAERYLGIRIDWENFTFSCSC